MVLAIVVLAALETWHSTGELRSAHQEAAQAETLAIARGFSADFTGDALRRPATLQAVLDRLLRLHPHVHRASIYALRDGRGMRVASTDPGQLTAPVDDHDTRPILTGRYAYEDKTEHGMHLAEIGYPLTAREGGAPVAALAMYVDLTPHDAGLAARERSMVVRAAVTAVGLSLIVILLLSRAVFRPLTRMQEATRRIRGGHLDTRLAWRRNDEIGALAGDFDEMADELERSHRRLEALASRDTLTGLLNHRTFQERLAGEVARARRGGHALSLVIFDLDHFKHVNDTHGHQVGDEVLAEAARRLAGQARTGEVVARVGGEEFAWIIPEADDMEAWRAADRAREIMAATPFPAAGTLTVSAGVCDLSRATDAAGLYRRADGALYWAKAHGRDMVVRYTPEVVGAPAPRSSAGTVQHQRAMHAIRILARAVDAKHPSTHGRSDRVAETAVALAGALGWPPERRSALHEAALVYDVGLIGTPDAILLTPGPLTEAEHAQVRSHAPLGGQIVADVLSAEQASWVRAHHERPDGGGYPEGLAGEEIPDGARILAVADAWDAMTAGRPYRAPMPVDDALAEIRRHAGTQFFPDAVAALAALAADGQTAAPRG
ncbi:MAG: diguanylate cyclase [Actinomycetota bacterium]